MTWQEIHDEYQAAKASRDAAEARLRAASDALLAAQCRVHYDTTRTSRGLVRHECTLPSGHTGDHGKPSASTR